MAKERKQWLVPHAAAELFPLMEGAEYEALKQDIAERGQLVPIVLHEGRILDGRNRYHACCDLEIEPTFAQYDGDSPTQYVVSLNLHRRHLSVSQQAMIGADILPALEAEAKSRQVEAGKSHGRGQATEKVTANSPEAIGESREQAAALVGVSARTISDAKAVKEADPELAQEVREGKVTVHAAKRQLEERSEPEILTWDAASASTEECEATSDLQSLIDQGKKFGLIYADPPWKYGNQGTRASTDNHYETMTVEQLAAMPVEKLAADEAHLHLWVTAGFLPAAFDLMKAWGFEYKSYFCWCKPQLGLGNYYRVSSEILLLGIRGGLVVPVSNRVKNWVELPRGKHSAKPHQLRMMVESMSPGPRLELFGRRVVPGWTIFGNQVQDEEPLLN